MATTPPPYASSNPSSPLKDRNREAAFQKRIVEHENALEQQNPPTKFKDLSQSDQKALLMNLFFNTNQNRLKWLGQYLLYVKNPKEAQVSSFSSCIKAIKDRFANASIKGLGKVIIEDCEYDTQLKAMMPKAFKRKVEIQKACTLLAHLFSQRISKTNLKNFTTPPQEDLACIRSLVKDCSNPALLVEDLGFLASPETIQKERGFSRSLIQRYNTTFFVCADVPFFEELKDVVEGFIKEHTDKKIKIPSCKYLTGAIFVHHFDRFKESKDLESVVFYIVYTELIDSWLSNQGVQEQREQEIELDEVQYVSFLQQEFKVREAPIGDVDYFCKYVVSSVETSNSQNTEDVPPLESYVKQLLYTKLYKQFARVQQLKAPDQKQHKQAKEPFRRFLKELISEEKYFQNAEWIVRAFFYRYPEFREIPGLRSVLTEYLYIDCKEDLLVIYGNIKPAKLFHMAFNNNYIWIKDELKKFIEDCPYAITSIDGLCTAFFLESLYPIYVEKKEPTPLAYQKPFVKYCNEIVFKDLNNALIQNQTLPRRVDTRAAYLLTGRVAPRSPYAYYT